VAERAVAAVTRILDTDDEHDVIVVAHGGVNRALVFGLGALDARTGLAMRQDWAGVDTLEQVDGAWHARTLNWTPAGVMELGVGRGGAPLALAPDPRMADAS
jgi:broad specificity phosphatase PhoE